jgi:histo-blood group ABO system transferase
MENKINKHLVVSKRSGFHNVGLIVVATGEYNQFIPRLISSVKDKFPAHIYLFTDSPENYESYNEITTIYTPHLGWPKMPLLRFELLNHYKSIYKENYLFILDSEAEIMVPITNEILSYRVATLHRNIMRRRKDFNYEKRIESTAYVSSDEGDQYYACGFVGGRIEHFKEMLETVSANIRIDIENGIRAIWGDESHVNRYFIDNPPTLVLPPNYMCPEGNKYFIPFIMHHEKQFKQVYKEDAMRNMNINKEDYVINWDNITRDDISN